MKSAIQFLTALAQAISTMNLYRAGHPARERAVDTVHERLRLLQEESPSPEFTFVGHEIVFRQRPLREMKTWDWGPRLAAAGVQRLEFTGSVTRDELEEFLEEILKRLTGGESDTSEARQTRPSNIRFGMVGLKGRDEEENPERLATATLAFTLREEADAIRWIHGELKDGRGLRLVEAEAVVRSLSVAMHGDQAFLIPLLRMKQYDQYTTTHALNVSVLNMALAEFIGLGPKEVKSFGIAGLLHDLGKVKIPDEILNKPGKFTEEERLIMNRHPAEGARIILETEQHLDLAAVVAYEHHIRLDGKGYPSFGFPRKCHQASDLTHVCDVFDALRTDRPYRPALATDVVFNIIEEGAGKEFPPDLAQAMIRMIRQWEMRIAEIEDEDQPLPIRVPASGPEEETGGTS